MIGHLDMQPFLEMAGFGKSSDQGDRTTSALLDLGHSTVRVIATPDLDESVLILHDVKEQAARCRIVQRRQIGAGSQFNQTLHRLLTSNDSGTTVAQSYSD
ncbi:hypothetical protein WJ01_12235 [Burkholderia vietnamiensis]|nr:hypothetical protein WJ01_12235 [Burkholderia vietnamiensis]